MKRISVEERGLGEASASQGQYEQGSEDVRKVPAGHGQDKQGADVRQVTAGCGQVTHDCGCAKQSPAGHRQNRVGPEPPQTF